MPLAGGPADKLGNRYELWWTVVQIQNILHSEWESIRIEVPGIDKAEFVLTRGSERAFHQSKRSAVDGRWSLSELSSSENRVLQGMEEQLRIPHTQYVFVSSSDARELAELSERARDSASLEEFDQYFVSGKEQHQRLTKIQKIWDCDRAVARDYLRRIEVRVLDEKSLKEQALLGAQTLFLAPPMNVCSEMRSLALDSVHLTLTRSDILAHFAKAGYRTRRVISLEHANTVVAEVTEKYLDTTRSRLIRGKFVPRAATDQLTSLFTSTGSDSVLTGRAGAGKTGCISEFIQQLVSSGVPVMAFRLDRVDPVSSTAELGKRLGLDESPALLLAAASESRRAALVIDQLDAISTTSGRTTQFFDAVESLLNEVRGLRPRADIHVVVVCREFDWKNDHRLRKLLPTGHNHIAIGEFETQQTIEILREAGYDIGSLRPAQIELLRLPQNLSMFLESNFTTETPLNGVLDLYDRYWSFKREAVARRSMPSPDNWLQTIQTIVDAMTDTQQLSIRRELLDSIPSAYVDQMVSEGVITRDGRRVGFGHESFFDYCFARLFVAKSASLIDFLLGSEQHLFRRAQVRQVLQYLHEDEPSRFCTELQSLITHPKIRFHLKELALAVAASTTTITEPEWSLWMKLLDPYVLAIRNGSGPDALSALVWRHFFGSASLFAYGLRFDLVRHWIESDDNAIADMGLSYLRSHEGRFSREVAAFLSPFVGRDETWRKRLLWFMQLTNLNGSREMFDLFLILIEDGTLDEARGIVAVNSTFWNLLYGISEQNSSRVCEIVGAWLRRQWKLAQQSGSTDYIIHFQEGAFSEEPIRRATRNAPSEFIRHVLPVIISISSWAADLKDELPRKDRVWRFLMLHRDGQRPHDAALSSLQDALTAVSATNPAEPKDCGLHADAAANVRC